MEHYSVLIEVRAPVVPDLDLDEALATLLDRLTDRGNSPVVSGSPEGWAARIFVQADDAAQAAVVARARTLLFARAAGLPTEPVVRAEAVREDVFDEDLARPQIPDLVSAAEIAPILGVTSQRVLALAATPAFPRPFIERPHAKLWVRAAVEQFAATWDRTPGRKPTRAKQVDEDTIRRRAVKGWAFEDLPDDEQAAIKAFLDGGDPAELPDRWRRRYAFEQRLAG